MISALYTKERDASIEHKRWESPIEGVEPEIQASIRSLQNIDPDSLPFVPRPTGGESLIIRIQEGPAEKLYCLTSSCFPTELDPLIRTIRDQGKLINDRQTDKLERELMHLTGGEALEA